jgi:phospholipid/cholesterol/gamma-HCH transport system substrate-binding protein
METRANYVTVGIFTLLAIIAAFAFVYWTAGLGDRGEVAQLRVRIPGSASGLGRGSAVLFNGVKVGEVQRVFIDINNPTDAIADTVVDRLTPITQSTQADIGLAGLTGTANIELKGGSLTETNLLDQAEDQNRIAEIKANPSAVTNLLQTAQSILTRADTVVAELEGFVKDARGPLTSTIENVQSFSEALDRNSDGIDRFLASVSDLSETLTGASQKLDSTLTAAEGILTAIEPAKVEQIVGDVQVFTSRLQTASQNLDQIMTGVDQAVASFNTLSGNATQTLARVDSVLENADGILEGVDPATVRTTLTNIEQASTTINRAANDIASVTETINGRRGEIDSLIADASQMADRLNQASVRVDGVLAKVDGLLGSGDAQGVMAELNKTIQQYRQVAETLNARLGPITDGLSRFTGQGLRDVEAFVADGRRAVNRIEQAITNLDRNPQRLITGGDGTVRTFDGRTRR